ncbi:MAG: class I lanthipeptide [Bacteroidota bacterium]
MKKVKFNGKLSLNKETITNLNEEQMNNIKGGDDILWSLLWCHTRRCNTQTEYTCPGWSGQDVTCQETVCVCTSMC